MVSSTAQTERRRRLKQKRAGRGNRKFQVPTPAFPVHPEGYSPKAVDAKKQAG